ncbi:MAG: lactate racemase domain-containing protein [Thermoguttaceae bacterium]
MQYFQVRQHFERLRVDNVLEETVRQLETLDWANSGRLQPGETVAITAGSRGIHAIAEITRSTVRFFQDLGLKPFIVPSMGSHGGGTADGQLALLAKYGMTESTLGCPIRSSLETVQLGSLAINEQVSIPVHLDRIACEADHRFLINRVKPHTRFVGPIESGLLKMMMIGLGNAIGASHYHRAIAADDFSTVLCKVTDYIQGRFPFLGGLAIVENAFDETAILRGVKPDQFAEMDAELLVHAKRLLPRLPFDEVDLLMIEQIGKNVSGTGLDSNVVGRKFDDHKAVRGEKPIVRLIAVLGLTPETGGNANGIGMSEFCKSSILREMNVQETRMNAITANHPTAAMIPLDYESEEDIIEAARHSLGQIPLDEMKILWIQDTLHLEYLRCSSAYLEEAKQCEREGRLEILG